MALLVARMSLEHMYLYTYREVVEALVIANLQKDRYQFVYAHEGTRTRPTCVASRGCCFRPDPHDRSSCLHFGDE